MEVIFLTVTNKEQGTQNHLASETNATITYVVESVISRTDLNNRRFMNKQEKIIHENPETITKYESHNTAIIEFLNSIYESILEEEAGGITQ